MNKTEMFFKFILVGIFIPFLLFILAIPLGYTSLYDAILIFIILFVNLWGVCFPYLQIALCLCCIVISFLAYTKKKALLVKVSGVLTGLLISLLAFTLWVKNV